MTLSALRHRTTLIRLALDHQTNLLTADEVVAVARALERQISKDFYPYWGVDARVITRIGSADFVKDAWVVALLDDSDQAGALGYHETTDAGLPMGKVFVKTDKDHGLEWTVTLSHEALEMLGDPFADLAAQVGQQTFLAYETADAVEADRLAYAVDGYLMSNFVYPNWFIPGSAAPWDFRHDCTSALELKPGGYIGVWTPKTGWTQAFADKARHEAGPRFRLRAEKPRQHHREDPAVRQLLKMANVDPMFL